MRVRARVRVRVRVRARLAYPIPEDGTRWARVGGLGLGSGLG